MRPALLGGHEERPPGPPLPTVGIEARAALAKRISDRPRGSGLSQGPLGERQSSEGHERRELGLQVGRASEVQ